jgi:pimeloyl-ACP methyl ester carboxylesterase
MSLNSKGPERKEGTVTAAGATVHYVTIGSGSETVLVLHGWGGSIQSMTPILEDLAKDYRVVALDMPGHGQSGLPPSSWNVGDYGACVLDALSQLDVVEPTVLAHSFGGRITIKLAAANPLLFKRLILVNAAGVRLPPTLKQLSRRLVARLGRLFAMLCGQWGRSVRDKLYHRIASRDYLAAGPLKETFVKVISEDLTPLLSHIAVPTLIIWGESDSETPLAIAQILNTHIINSRLVVLKNAGHFSYIDQFGQFRLLVRQFLNHGLN